MNSTTDPIPSDALDTIVAAWSGVAFSALSCGIIARKALLDFTYLRCACVIVAILTLSLSSANVLRSSGMPESSFLVFQAILTTLFVDLLVGIAFSLGARLYAPAGRLNALYWTTFAVTGLMNTLEFVRLVLFLAFSPDLQSDFLLVNRVFNAIGWGFFFVALLLAFLYAFIPMIKPKTAENEMPSSLLVVIAWYLTGLSVLCLLHIIPFGIFAAYPEHYNKDVNIKATTVLIFLRLTALDFYSFRPSGKIVHATRQKLFPNSIQGTRLELQDQSAQIAPEQQRTTSPDDLSIITTKILVSPNRPRTPSDNLFSEMD